MRTINLEAGMPTSLDAMNTLNNRIYAERATGARCVKIIHGYGSTGRGGTIRTECRRKLLEYKVRHVIKQIVPGEKFGPFSEEGRSLSAVCPEVRKDIDWGRDNPGITVVMFK